MKATPLLLGGSLAANAILLVMLVTAPPAADAPAHSDLAPASAVSNSAAKPAREPMTVAATPVAPMPKLGSAAIRASYFSALAARLRAEGYSDEVVRRVVGNLISHHFAERGYATIRPKHDPLEYWRSPVVFADAAESAARRKLEREQTAMAREVFGPDFEFSGDRAARLFHGISASSVARMTKMFSDYQELEDQIRDQATAGENIGSKLKLLETEKRADLERILSAEELHTYDLRNGPASHRLRAHFGAFQPTEAEFLALYPVAKQIIDAERGTSSRTTREARLAQQTELDAAARRVMTTARFAEFERSRRRP